MHVKRSIFYMLTALCLLLVLTLFFACDAQPTPQDEDASQQPQDGEKEKGDDETEPVGNPIVEFAFSTGDKARFVLYPEQAPITVANFLRYVDEGFYTGTVIHRVQYEVITYEGVKYAVPYVVQGGGYTDDYRAKAATHPAIKGEFAANGVENEIKHVRGTISMARMGDPYYDSATSQFFFCPIEMKSWDGNYAAFGKAYDEETLATITKLARVQTDAFYRPVEVISILSVTRIGYQAD